MEISRRVALATALLIPACSPSPEPTTPGGAPATSEASGKARASEAPVHEPVEEELVPEPAEEEPVPVDPSAFPHGAALGETFHAARSLRDLRGNRRSLREVDAPVIVLAFLGTQCPVANREVPGIVEMEHALRDRGVQFLGIYPNEHETFDEIAAHAYDRGIPFPAWKDIDQELAEALGVTRTPHYVVLDAERVVRYSGRSSDRFVAGGQRAEAGREDLRLAVEHVLARRPVTLALTEVEGCLLDRRSERPAREGVTYAEHVAPILARRCQPCHRPGEAAPFPLLTYDDAVRRSRMIREVVMERRMPPWHADRRYGEFANDRSLSAEEIDHLVSWIDAGMPRGDPADVPEPIEWPEGWSIGEPDAVVESPRTLEIPAQGPELFEYVLVPAETTRSFLPEDRWLRAAEIVPSDRTVVHHVLAYICHPGDDVDAGNVESVMAGVIGWVPGEPAWTFPEGSAMRIPAGAQIFIEMHYVPTGVAATDRPKIGLYFAEEEPERILKLSNRALTSLRVPAGDPHYAHAGALLIARPTRILGLMGHMHGRGKAFTFDAIYPDGRTERLLSVPRYDFNWQTFYWLEEPLEVPAETTIRLVGHWDNSELNLSNPDPESDAVWGWEFTAEMLIGWVYHEVERHDEALAELAYERGVALAKQEKFEAAAEKFAEAARILPRFAQAHSSLGVTLRNLGDLDEAEEAFREAIRHSPRFVTAYRNLAGLLMRRKRFAEVVPLIETIVEQEPEDAMAHRNLVNVLLSLGRREDAVTALRRAKRHFPDDAQLAATLERLERGSR